MAASQRSNGGSSSSQTQGQIPAPTTQITTVPAPRQAVLRLRGATRESEAVDEESEGSTSGGRARRKIKWAEDVVDNEGLGRKKSKVCCIYHAPKAFGESSDESSSDSDDSDSADDGAARPTGGARRGHNHDHDHGHGHEHGKAGKGKARASSPNAYEKIPRTKKHAPK